MSIPRVALDTQRRSTNAQDAATSGRAARWQRPLGPLGQGRPGIRPRSAEQASVRLASLGAGMALLDDIRNQINDRLAELRPVAHEYERLQQAHAALAASSGTDDATARSARSASARCSAEPP